MGDYLMSNKPNAIVAEQIVEELLKKRLLSEDRKEEWIKKLSSEKIYPEEWNLLAEFYIKQKE